MTEEENRKLAEWMGGKYFDSYLGNGYKISNGDGTHRLMWSEMWHPRTSIEQAMMLLDRFLSWEIRRYSKSDYRCRINDETLIEGPMESTPEAAIVEAVMRVIEEG